MTRINLVKYGFIRWPEEDFSDDGNHFTCYRVGKRVRVSKLVSDGEVYLSADSQVGNGTLPYEVYSKLPHYKQSSWDYNGVQITDLTEQDLKDLYDACIAYEQEYEAAENAIEYPSLEEIRDKASRITNHAMLELSKIENRLNRNMREAITKFSSYEWKQLQEYFNAIIRDTQRYDIATYPQTIIGQQFSFTFVKPDYGMSESYWFTSLVKLFEKYNLD
jgi:hypothetical protein